MRSAIVIGASSDIGAALAERWLKRGWTVGGTYRTTALPVDRLASQGAALVACDLSSAESVRAASDGLRQRVGAWDVLVVCPGAQEPVGPFESCNFDEWEASIRVNFVAQMRMVHDMLPSRRAGAGPGPCVLLFAGGGTNDAPVNYSAYIASKIALIKMCDLLDAEIPDTRFVILGPGWVKTKIHAATLAAGERAGRNRQRTIEKLASDECTPMESVLDCCDWIVSAPREIVGGRNFSVQFDRWGTPGLAHALAANPRMYRLGRIGNDLMVADPRAATNRA